MKKRKLLGKKKYTLQYEALLMGQQFPLWYKIQHKFLLKLRH